MDRRLRVLLLEPHGGGSHLAVANGWRKHSRHLITLDTLPPRNWKWRLRAAGLVFAERHRSDARRHHVVLASSLMNVADFRATVPRCPPVVLYMHESQLSYPRPTFVANENGGTAERRSVARRLKVTPAAGSPPRDWGLLFADLASAAAADSVLFNSSHHRRAFLDGAARLIASVPDATPRGLLARIRRVSRVVPPGIEAGDIPLPGADPGRGRRGAEIRPAILWNHRWEFDKRPDLFFAALRGAEAAGARFRLILIGESARIVPKYFLEGRERFGGCLLRYGRVSRRRDYLRCLSRADIVVSTAEHENFGVSWLEAMAAGAWPLLPAREAYPELLPRPFHAAHLYRGIDELERRLVDLCSAPARLATGRAARATVARRFAWERRIGDLDAALQQAADGPTAGARQERAR